MNMKTLFGTAAGLMVASSAYAADLPGEAAPAAVDYVKVCDAFGKGFFYIPGTDTCLKMSGRVRARVVYADGDTLKNGKDTDTVTFKTDARVQFDARSASDLGTVRSFFGIKLDGGNVVADDALIQVGYVTVGKIGYLSSVFYGDNDAIYGLYDQSSVGAQVMVDDLGGGFYVGGAVQGADFNKGHNKWVKDIWTTGNEAAVAYSGRVGITKQSWGAFDLTGIYQTIDGNNNNVWSVKGSADLNLIDNLSARLVGAYTDLNYNNFAAVAASLKYQATDSLSVYGGVSATFWDKKGVVAGNINGDKTVVSAQVGADYALAKGLILTAEVNYLQKGGDAGPAASPTYFGKTDDSWTAMLKLTRNW